MLYLLKHFDGGQERWLTNDKNFLRMTLASGFSRSGFVPYLYIDVYVEITCVLWGGSLLLCIKPLSSYNAEHSWRCRSSTGCFSNTLGAERRGIWKKVPNGPSPREPNTTCSCEMDLQNHQHCYKKREPSFPKIPLHRAHDHGITSSLWTAADVHVPPKLWQFWTNFWIIFLSSLAIEGAE